jgi:Ca2+-binding EF-hand superfamily protein
VFEEIDKNGDGLLEVKEIEEIMKKLNKEDKTKKVFAIMDYEKDGSVSYEEFIKTMIDRKTLRIKENIKKCFDAIDVDGSGKLSLEEVRRVSHVKVDSKENQNFTKMFNKYSNGKNLVKLIR